MLPFLKIFSATLVLRISHKFSIRFRFGLFTGHSGVVTFCLKILNELWPMAWITIMHHIVHWWMCISSLACSSSICTIYCCSWRQDIVSNCSRFEHGATNHVAWWVVHSQNTFRLITYRGLSSNSFMHNKLLL